MNSYILVFGVIALVAIMVAWIVLALRALRRHESEADRAWEGLEEALADRFDVASQVVDYAQTDTGNTKLQESAQRAMNSYAQAYQQKDPQWAGKAEKVFADETMPLLASSIKSTRSMDDTVEVRQGISRTDKAISKVRKNYNEVALRFNTRISQIPTNVIASALRIEERKPFLDPAEASARMLNLEFD